MARVRGEVGWDAGQEKPKGTKGIQALFTSLKMLGTGRGQKEVRINPRSILENHHQTLGAFCGKERGEENEGNKRKRGEGNVGGKDEGQRNENGTPSWRE